MILSRALVADLALVGVTVLAALGWVFSRESLAVLAPLIFLALRFLLSAVILCIFDLRQLRALDRSQWRRAWGTGTILGLQTLLWVLGLFHAEQMGIGAFLMCLGFVLVPLVGRLLFQVKTHLHTWLAMIVSLTGLGLLLLENQFHLHLSDIYFLGAALVFSLYFNVNGRYSNRIPAISLTVIQLLAAGVVTLTASLLLEPITLTGLSSVLGWVLAAILIATALRFLLLVKAQSQAHPAHAAVIMTLEPMWVVLLGVLCYDESLAPLQVAGCGLIFSGLVVNAVGNVLAKRRCKVPALSG